MNVTVPAASRATPRMPAPVGPMSEVACELLAAPDGPSAPGLDLDLETTDPLGDLDLQRSLYCLHELHYRGFADVAPDAEWHPAVVALWQRLAGVFETGLLRCCPIEPLPGDASAGDAIAEAILHAEGPSLSATMADHPSLDAMREFAIHRSAYQLKEADPHSFALPRLGGTAKSALVAIQMDEYGDGRPGRAHAELFAATMRALGVDDAYGAHVERLPATTLATSNLMSHLALHGRLLPALLGHLALFEMTSVQPMRRYAELMRHLDMPDSACAFYDVHVSADEYHGPLARTGLVDAYVTEHPDAAALAVWGARITMVIERRFADHLLRRWAEGRSSLR